MPEFVPHDDDDDESTQQRTTEAASHDLPKIEIGGEKMRFEEAVDMMAKMVDNPEAFDIPSGSQVRDINSELSELRQAVAEMADAIEMLSEHQAKLFDDSEIPATVALEDERMGDVFDPTDYDVGGSQ